MAASRSDEAGALAAGEEPYGYLLAHFREEPTGYAERIHFALSDGDSPLRWRPLHGGGPVLTSTIGTTGVRDPALVRDAGGRFHILATDLRVFGGDDRGWDHWRRHGSRSLIVWDSDDLDSWSGPRAVEVAPPEAGMAWAPEVTTDPATGEAIVFWSSTLFPPDDPTHRASTYSRILFSRTRDFVAFSPAEIMIDAARDVIDTAIVVDDGLVHRFSKDEDRGADSWGVFHEVGSGLFAEDFRVVTRRIGLDVHPDVEAPIVLRAPTLDRWYLFLDRYNGEQGYFVLEADTLLGGQWRPVAPELTAIPPQTKHGTILRLVGDEWARLDASLR